MVVMLFLPWSEVVALSIVEVNLKFDSLFALLASFFGSQHRYFKILSFLLIKISLPKVDKV